MAESSSKAPIATSEYIIRLRNIPWQATETDVRDFFKDIDVKKIHFTYTLEGKKCGEAYVELYRIQDMDRAVKRSDQKLGTRPIEIIKFNRREMEIILQKVGTPESASGGLAGEMSTKVIKLRGIPYNVAPIEIAEFFRGLTIVERDGIFIPRDILGSTIGHAFVTFATEEDAEDALRRHNQNIRHRNIEVYRSSEWEKHIVRKRMEKFGGSFVSAGPSQVHHPFKYEQRTAAAIRKRYGEEVDKTAMPRHFVRPVPTTKITELGPSTIPSRLYSKHGRFPADAHCVYVRGFPYNTTEDQIEDFFAPLHCKAIHMMYDKTTDKPGGEAEVEFYTHDDALEGMQKNQMEFGRRFVTLYLNSSIKKSGQSSGAGTSKSAVESRVKNSEGHGMRTHFVEQWEGKRREPNKEIDPQVFSGWYEHYFNEFMTKGVPPNLQK